MIRGLVRVPLRAAGMASSRLQSRRLIHQAAEMTHLSADAGIKGLLSPAGLDIAWNQYQNHVLTELNTRIKGTYFEDSSVYQIMRDTADTPDYSDVNFYASQAYTNEFFFETLKDSAEAEAVAGASSSPSIDISTDISNSPVITAGSSVSDPAVARLSTMITDSFDSAAAFRELLINRADAIFGNGTVWLVWLSDWELRLVNSYNAGTPLSHVRNSDAQAPAHNTRRAFEHQVNSSYEVTKMVPLLAVNGWQHVYLKDYGVAGKRAYLENLFNCIDWTKVARRLPTKQAYGGMYL